jgi:putative inorganic carbon (HCO3(-)) transporter
MRRKSRLGMQHISQLARRWVYWLLAAVTVVVGVVLLLTQSRAGIMAAAVSLLFMALVPWRVGRWVLAGLFLVILVGLPLAPNEVMEFISNAPVEETLRGGSSLHFRQQVWARAVQGLHDFPWTGMGLGTFRELVFVLYGLDVVASNNDIGHAHSIFLQAGLDFGVLGLAAYVALFMLAALMLVVTGQGRNQILSDLETLEARRGRIWAVGLGGSLVGQLIFGQLDAVALGAKTDFFFWYFLALVFVLGNLRNRGEPVSQPRQRTSSPF